MLGAASSGKAQQSRLGKIHLSESNRKLGSSKMCRKSKESKPRVFREKKLLGAGSEGCGLLWAQGTELGRDPRGCSTIPHSQKNTAGNEGLLGGLCLEKVYLY